jgi:hypothetical protein
MTLLKERPSIGIHRGKGREGDLNRCGEDQSTMRQQKKRRAGAKLKRMAGNRIRWQHFVDALCPLRDNRNVSLLLLLLLLLLLFTIEYGCNSCYN